MKRYLTYILFMMLSLMSFADDTHTYTARVVAGDNRKPLAYATIFVRSGIGTMTNEDGDFSINVLPDDELQISYMGFSTFTVKAKDLKSKVVLKPMENSLAEVTVISEIGVLNKVMKKLEKEYKKNKKVQSQYFLRQVTSTLHKELVEGFLEAKDAVNLREMNMLAGRHGRIVKNDLLQRPLIADMNFHHPFELGPMINESKFWEILRCPFYTINGLGKSMIETKLFSRYYDSSLETLIDDANKKFYKITITPKSTRNVCLGGTLLVDAEDYQLLSFDCYVNNMFLDVKEDFAKVSSPIDLNVKINYRDVKGFTEVENIIYTMKTKGVYNKAMLINIDRLSTDKKGKVVVENVFAQKGDKTKVSENMLKSLNIQGFDSIMSQNADFVKRTKEEKDLADGKVLTSDEMLTTDYKVASGDSTRHWTLSLPDDKFGNMVNRLAKMGKVLPQEKVYVQMDNTCYFLGDTIWYSAYLRRTSDDKPSNISGILYVELLNQDGYVLQRQMVDIKGGRGFGNFVTDTDWYGGFYELRAYTRWQLNWGVYEREHSTDSEYWFINKEMEHRYFRDYDKLYSRVFPMYDAPKTKGKYSEIMSTRQLRRYFKNDPDKRTLQVNLYPEGGELIAGVPCRIAFEAVYSDGEYADGELCENSGKRLAHTVNRGRGVFTYTPRYDSDVEFVFKSSSNSDEAKVKFKDVYLDGAVLNVSRNDSLWNIHVSKVGALHKDTLGMTVMHDGRVRWFSELCGSDTIITIPHDSLETGVNQFTVFGSKGNVISDRLFFVSRPDAIADNISITGLKEQYSPYEKINIGVHKMKNDGMGKDSMNVVSVSIRDMEHADNLHDNGTMQSEMLLSSEVKGFIPNPGWFFEKDDNEHRDALDLLMMTQGWRRFDWRKMAIRGEWDLTQPDEKTPKIVGDIYKYPPYYFYNDDEYIKAFEDDRTLEDLDESGNSNPDVVAQEEAVENSGFVEESTQSTESEGFTDYSKSIEYIGGTRTVKPSVMVHAYISKIGVDDDYATVETFNKNGKFRLVLPKFHGRAVFFLSAADTAKIGDKDSYHWIEGMPDKVLQQHRKFQSDYPPFSIRVDFPYPRFVKPYNFYQERISLTTDNAFGEKKLSDGSYQLSEVKVGAKHSGIHMFSDSVPALIVDGYEAYNFTLDAGMRHATPFDIARAYVGDYGSPRPYVTNQDGKRDYKISTRRGAGTLERMFSGNTINEDSLYRRSNLETHQYMNERLVKTRLQEVEKYVLYTDYAPRNIGSKRYQGANLPVTINAVYPYLDDMYRQYYRERRYIIDGIATPDEFYSPDYSKCQLPDMPADYRRTLYWNPNLKLDSNGTTTIIFWNNSNTNHISVKAEGMTSDGTILKGEK